MSKLVKPQNAHHIAILRCDGNDGEMLLVKGGRRAHLWCAPDPDGQSPVLTFSGQQSLRAFARMILREIPARKSK